MLTTTRTSVIIPAFNAERYLAEALASVAAQQQPASEIIVIDDGSTDATGEIARQTAGVICVRQENAGVAAALNHGVRLARGDYVAFLSADDIWVPQKLDWQSHSLQAGAQLVFGHMQHFISPELSPAEAALLVCPPDPMPAFSAGTLLTAAETFRAIGPLNESFAVGEFMEWYGRAVDRGVAVTMRDEVVSMRRVHASNHSKTTLRDKSYAPVLRAIMERRRAAQGK